MVYAYVLWNENDFPYWTFHGSSVKTVLYKVYPNFTFVSISVMMSTAVWSPVSFASTILVLAFLRRLIKDGLHRLLLDSK